MLDKHFQMKCYLRHVQKICVHFILIIFLRCNLHDDFGLFMLLETTTPRVNEYFILEEFLEFKESSFLECLFVFLHNDLNKPHWLNALYFKYVFQGNITLVIKYSKSNKVCCLLCSQLWDTIPKNIAYEQFILIFMEMINFGFIT